MAVLRMRLCSFFITFTLLLMVILELSDDDGDMERLQLLESGSSDISFRSHEVSEKKQCL